MKRCPLCGCFLGARPALSRKDNETLICSDCGFREAMEDFAKYYVTKRGETKKDD